MISYDYINDYIRDTLKQNRGFLKELEEFAKIHHVPIVQPEVAKLLIILGKLLKPERILEVGTAIGYSSILLSGALKDNGKIDTIERYLNRAEEAKENIKSANLDNVINIIVGDALEVLECIDNRYDMIFMDAAKGHYIDFLPHALRMLNKGGVLIADNVLYKGMIANDELVPRRQKTIVRRMRDFLDAICQNERLETDIMPIGDGVSVSYKLG